LRRGVGILAVVVGVGIMLIPVAYSLVGRTGDAERILDRFEFLTLGSNPARYLDEAETTRAGSTELVGEAIPGLASDAGVGGDELDTRFPALETAQREVPEAHEFSVRYSKQLDDVDEKFKSVYDIPTSSLPLTATPWLFLAGGLACLVAGLVALRTRGRGPIAVIAALGAAIVVGLLAFSAPGRSADGEDVKDFASNGLTARAATAARQASTALDDLVRETDQDVLPYLASRQGISRAEVDGELGRRFEAADRFLAEWDVVGPRLARLAAAVSASVEEFESAEKMPIAFPVWLLFGAGAAMGVAGGVALLRERG
jgi:hypothetical protein